MTVWDVRQLTKLTKKEVAHKITIAPEEGSVDLLVLGGLCKVKKFQKSDITWKWVGE